MDFADGKRHQRQGTDRWAGDKPSGQSHAFLLSPVFSAFSESDPRWTNLSYAGSSDKIGGTNGKGCALTSLAMALTGAGIAQDPGLLNSLLMTNGGYDKGGNVQWDSAVNTAAKAAGTPDISFHDVRSSSTSVLDNLLSQGHPVIVAVNPTQNSQGQTQWGHFVVVTGKQGSSYTINDPGWPNSRTTLDAYNNVFETRGYVADPPDVSAIDISVAAPGSGVNLLLTDSHGNKTGIDGSGIRSESIPNSVHFIDAIVGLDSNQPPTTSPSTLLLRTQNRVTTVSKSEVSTQAQAHTTCSKLLLHPTAASFGSTRFPVS